ncbi:MAG: hypothetical protein JXQ96_20230 [Cyclobacteriaceae bacterium]
MRIILSILLIAISFSLYSQKTTFKKTKSNNYSEEYFVLRSNKKIKHGPYRKLNISGDLIAEGAFRNNKKVGRWAYYTNSSMDQIYDHTSKELVSFNYENQQYDVLLNNEIENFRLDRPPMFIGGKVLLTEVIAKNITFPEQFYNAVRVIAAVTIGENDNLIDVQIVRGNSESKKGETAGFPEYETKVILALKQIKSNWMSGILDGKAIKSRCILEIAFLVHLSEGKEIKVE